MQDASALQNSVFHIGFEGEVCCEIPDTFGQIGE